ncbi:MAG: P-type Cu+ transporter [Patescibacteria group bacterium]|jgi:Cu2+-exporting ATPase/Cu+-exporting ATPase|nr:P-type Cu+ transporter [Patescibacteria group bacterium]
MAKITAHVSGMHCASCVTRVEKTLAKQPGVQDVAVNFATEEARLTVADEAADLEHLSESLKPFGYALHPKQTDVGSASPEMSMNHGGQHDHASMKMNELLDLKMRVVTILPLVCIAAAMMTWDIASSLFDGVPEMSYVTQEFFHHLLPIMASYALFVTGRPYLRGLWMFLRKGIADMDSLVGLGTVSAFLYSFIVTAFEQPLASYLDVSVTYYDVTIVVIGLITLGKYLEARARMKTGNAIKQLIGLQAKGAIVIRNGEESEVELSQVQVGDVVVVKPGMKIPVDGVLLESVAYIDQSLLTGEPLPAEKHVGDQLSAGTLNTTGHFTMRATSIGADTLLAHIIRLVSDAQGSKAPLQRLADKIASIFVPIVVVIAVLTLGIWLGVGSQYLPFSQALSYGLVSFVSVLVIACPCALGLATPTAIIVGVGRGALRGILFKNAEVLERLHKMNVLVIDKTGTLTVGKPTVREAKAGDGLAATEALAIIASLESRSEHPLGQAVVEYAKQRGATLLPVTEFKNLPGQGVQGVVEGNLYYAAGPGLLKQLGVTTRIDLTERSASTLITLTDGKTDLYAVALGDALKPEAKAAVTKLQSLGIQVIMASGDNLAAARAVAQEVGITEVLADALPQAKLEKIQALQAGGAVVGMAGDGVNDAPALAQADIGIAMATGSDVSIETGDITLLHGDIRKIAEAVALSKATVRTVQENLFWAFIYNVIGMPLAAGLFFPIFGWLLSPVFAGFAMAMSSVSVVSNSLRLKYKTIRYDR